MKKVELKTSFKWDFGPLVGSGSKTKSGSSYQNYVCNQQNKFLVGIGLRTGTIVSNPIWVRI